MKDTQCKPNIPEFSYILVDLVWLNRLQMEIQFVLACTIFKEIIPEDKRYKRFWCHEFNEKLDYIFFTWLIPRLLSGTEKNISQVSPPVFVIMLDYMCGRCPFAWQRQQPNHLYFALCFVNWLERRPLSRVEIGSESVHPVMFANFMFSILYFTI